MLLNTRCLSICAGFVQSPHFDPTNFNTYPEAVDSLVEIQVPDHSTMMLSFAHWEMFHRRHTEEQNCAHSAFRFSLIKLILYKESAYGSEDTLSSDNRLWFLCFLGTNPQLPAVFGIRRLSIYFFYRYDWNEYSDAGFRLLFSFHKASQHVFLV